MAGTTQFLNEAEIKIVSREHVFDIPQGLLSATRVGYNQGINEFMAKPVVAYSGVWSNQTAGSVLSDVAIPNDVLTQLVYQYKTQGFLGFRAKAVLKVQVNGNKFQAGRLLVVFIPQGNVTDTYPGMRIRSLIAATQLPRVELDLSTDTEVTMEVPYISPTPYYNLDDNTGPHGRVYIMVYSPLATGLGSTSVGVTLWVHFEDVELVAPAAFAQMADVRPSRRKKNPTELEQAANSRGPISGGLRLLSQAASSFAAVPLLSSVAGKASWALECISGAVSAFGYSKPTSEAVSTKIQTTFQFHTQNFNGEDYFPVMGMDGTNKMSVLPGFAGTDVDEMSLSHLLQIPAYFDNFSWALTDAANTNLYSTTIHPNAFITNAIVNLWSTRDCPPVSYFTSFFEFWRGSFVITLKVIKTTFHSGRLLIVYNPSSSLPSVTDSAYCFREIIDIRDTSEFRFVIPYVATTQYRPSNTMSGLEVTDGIGVFGVYVLNELVGPDTVSSAVDILLEVAAGPDYEVMFPRPHGMAPIITSGWQAQMADVAPSKISAQSESSRPDRNQEVVAVGSSSIVPPAIEPALYCVGERVNSILQLMKRYTIWVNLAATTTTRFAIDFRPFTSGYCYTANPVALITDPTGDYYSMFAPCFAYGRGSVRIAVVLPPAVHQTKDQGYVAIYPSTGTATIQDSSAQLTKVGCAVNFQPAVGDILPSGCTIPPYQQLHTRLLRPTTSLTVEPVDIYSTRVRAQIGTTDNSAAGKGLLFRAAGDDLTFGYFLGTPLVTTSISY